MPVLNLKVEIRTEIIPFIPSIPVKFLFLILFEFK